MGQEGQVTEGLWGGQEGFVFITGEFSGREFRGVQGSSGELRGAQEVQARSGEPREGPGKFRGVLERPGEPKGVQGSSRELGEFRGSLGSSGESSGEFRGAQGRSG